MRKFITKSLSLNKASLRNYNPKFQEPLKPGVDYIVDKNFVEDPVDLAKRITNLIEKKQVDQYIPMWRNLNQDILDKKLTHSEAAQKEKELHDAQHDMSQKEQATVSIDDTGYNAWQDYFKSGKSSSAKFDDFYTWFTSQDKSVKKAFLSYLNTIHRQDVIQKIEAIFLRKLMLIADRNMQKEKQDHKEAIISTYSEVNWEMYPKKLREEYQINEMNKVLNEEIANNPEHNEKQGLGPNDAYFVDKMDQVFEGVENLVPKPDKTQFRHAKRFSQNVFPQFKGSDPKDMPKRDFVNPDDSIFTEELKEIKNLLEEYDLEHFDASNEVLENIQSLRLATAGFSSPQGYAGHPDYDLEFPKDDTGSMEVPEFSREPFDERNLNDENNEGQEGTDWIEEMREESKATFLDFQQFPFIEIPVWAKRTTVRGPQGRLWSESCFLMIANKAGFIGYGYGMAATKQSAKERAKQEAIRNLRSIRLTNGRMIQDEVRAHYRGTRMILTPRKKGIRAHPLFKAIMENFLHLDGMSLKIHGSKNPLRIIPLFFKLMENVMTMEQRTIGRGLIPLYANNKYGDYLENVRRNRGQFGWH